MKNIHFGLFLAFFATTLMFSQNSTSEYNTGDVFTIAKVNQDNYKHIKFPRANFIIKKGGLANYNNVVGEKVEITSVDERKNGKRMATVKLVESRRFFNSHKYVTVDIDKAIENKELLKVKN